MGHVEAPMHLSLRVGTGKKPAVQNLAGHL